MTIMKKHYWTLAWVSALLVLAGCGVLPKQSSFDKVDAGEALEIPPDLDSPESGAALRVPDATYSAVAGGAVTQMQENPLDGLEGVKLVEIEGEQLLALSDTTTSVYRRLGLALDRLGLEVDGQDEESRSYQISYVDRTARDQRPGVLSRWFLRKKGPADHSGKYNLVVQSLNENVTLIKVTGKDSGRVADRVLDDVLVPLRDRLG
ncbi:MAG: outer membrane protein assembly factor BamC [Lysobacterales bacterium]